MKFLKDEKVTYTNSRGQKLSAYFSMYTEEKRGQDGRKWQSCSIVFAGFNGGVTVGANVDVKSLKKGWKK